MPKFTLRLTDEQHAELVAGAERGHRSLQKEIIHRLFSPDEILRTATGEVIGPRSRIWDPDVKPDPKPEKKK